MSPFILITIIVFALLVVGLLIVAAVSLRNSNPPPEHQGMHPPGYWVSMGISIGAGFGVALGLALGNIALGIPIGAAIGSVVGGIWEQRNKDKIRPLTEQEKKMQRWGIVVGVFILLIGMGVFTALLLLRGG